jgi:hypothetical protein
VKHTKKRALAVSLLVALVASATFASVVYAQTTNSTTSATTTTTNADSARNGPFDMLLGPLLDVFVHNKSMNVNATTETDSVNATHQPLRITGDRCHGAPQQEKQGKESRNAIATWYQQLSTDQKNALQGNLKEAYNNWYSQLPQDQKDKLQSVLNQTSETQ